MGTGRSVSLTRLCFKRGAVDLYGYGLSVKCPLELDTLDQRLSDAFRQGERCVSKFPTKEPQADLPALQAAAARVAARLQPRETIALKSNGHTYEVVRQQLTYQEGHGYPQFVLGSAAVSVQTLTGRLNIDAATGDQWAAFEADLPALKAALGARAKERAVADQTREAANTRARQFTDFEL